MLETTLLQYRLVLENWKQASKGILFVVSVVEQISSNINMTSFIVATHAKMQII